MNNSQKQVNKDHYNFQDYVNKERWSSYWQQLHEILKQPFSKILTIGVGDGIVSNILSQNNKEVTTADIDAELNPTVVASVTNLPFQDNEFEVCCAFQVLEHMPYKESLLALEELLRVSEQSVIISLPNQKPVRRYLLSFPYVRQFKFLIGNPFYKPKIHEFDGEHYWEINAKNYELNKILLDFENIAKKYNRTISSHRLFENPYHHFFIFK